jgi:hypothetical protein
MMKYLNLEYSVQDVSSSAYIEKWFVSDKISSQVSFFSRGPEWNIAKLNFSQVPDIPSVAPQI